MKIILTIIVVLAFATAGGVIGYLDPTRPEHMTQNMNVFAGMLSCLVTLAVAAQVCKDAKAQNDRSFLRSYCYFESSLDDTDENK